MNDKPEAVRMMLVPEHPTYEQLAKMSGPWCCTVEEMAESWAELLDNIEATPQPDASALVEVLKAIRELCPEVTGDTSSASLAGLLFNIETRCDAALTAWEAQHG
ncbi:MAG: hypothetical protein MK060_15750 [Blastomonas sp.]|jgi:hypothetical protein|nr:hypothetical protein [Marinobacter sp.]MCH2239334.1 hypothetical protein [Blastomonas sp.]|tara:strand:- start:7 stop:321 length:315 start_codon:yes stop_codon:yes gene_type:complete